MKLWNKILVALLVLAMMVPVMVMANAEEMPKISWLISCDSEVPTEDAIIVQAMREASGIDIQPIYVMSTEYSTKLSTYIASGSLPDIFFADSVTAKELINYGAVLDFSDLIQAYGENILADGEQRLTFGINKDGAVYGLPTSMSYPWAMAVRRDWMKNLGYEIADDVNVMEMGITEFTELMYNFTWADPDQDGKDDTFGFVAEDSSIGMFAPIFTAYDIPMKGFDSMYYDEETNACYSVFKHPNMLEALKKFNYFYLNSCMDTEFAVVADASTEFQLLWNSTAGSAAWSPAGMTNNWVGRYTEEGVDENSFIYINITADDGSAGGYVVSYPNSWRMIAATCKNPEAAVKLMDFMYTVDGDTLAYLGIEDVHYTWTDKANSKYAMTEAYADKSNQRTDGGWILWNQIHGDNNFELRSLTKITVDCINYAKEHQCANAAICYETPEIASELGGTLNDVWMQLFANATVAPEGTDLEAMYNEYVARYDSFGGLVYEQQFTELYLG